MSQLLKLFLVCCITESSIPVHAQSVISTNGANATGSGGTVSYTIGQVSFSTFSSATGTYSLKILSGKRDIKTFKIIKN